VINLDKVKRSHGPYIAAWNIFTPRMAACRNPPS
jgi:hypothetical protein